MSIEMTGRILARAKELGLSPRGASVKAGLGSTFIRDLVRRPDASPSADNLTKIAAALETTSEWLSNGGTPQKLDAGDPEVRQVKVFMTRAIYGGIIEAGSFRSVDEFDDEEHIRRPIYETVDEEFPEAKIVVFDVMGDSMNALMPNPIPPGFKVVCFDFESLKNRAPVRDGMVVVVEQRLKGGLLRERSVKQIELYRDRTEYCPRSTNPKHKPIVVPFDQDLDDGREVEILAIVKRITTDVLI